MPSYHKTLKDMEDWISDPYADDFPLGIMQNALELLKAQHERIERLTTNLNAVLEERNDE